MKGKDKRDSRLRSRYLDQIKKKKAVFIVYCILRAIVIAVMVRSIFIGNYQNAALCALSLVLFMIPSIAERTFGFELPSTLEIIVLFFIFAAEILGEINCYYLMYPGWDTLLHTVNGFLCAAIGFALVDMFNRSERLSFKLSPIYMALVAFCFSMTVGVIWEFFEFGMDKIFMLDMQKDTLYDSFATVTLDPTQSNEAVKVADVTKTVIYTASGEAITIEGGYLDIGIFDTMKDLLVNFIGAVVFSVIGFFYVRSRGNGRFAKHFIPKVNQNSKDENNNIQAE